MVWYGIVYRITVTTVATGQATYTRHCISHPPSELQRVYYEYFGENWPMLLWHNIIWECGSLITWFCSQTRAKPGNQTARPTWRNPYCLSYLYMKQNNIPLLKSFCQHNPLAILPVQVCSRDTIYSPLLYQHHTGPVNGYHYEIHTS